MTGSQIEMIIVIALYMCLLIGIGVYNGKKNKNTEDFYLGGRRMGPYVVAMSAEASDMSSWLLMGLPGVAYVSGLADPFWTAVGLALGTYLNWLFTSRKLRRYSQEIGAYTVPGYLAKRFHDEKHVIDAIGALMCIIFFTPYVASGFSACGKLANSLFGIEYMTGVIFFGIIIIIYTMIGGFATVATNDFIQSIVMSIALVTVVGYGVSKSGGLDGVMENANSMAGYFKLNAMHDPSTGESVGYGLLTIISVLAWGIGYFGMPHILVRFMSIKDEKKLVLSRRIASVWVVIAMGVAIFIGITGNALSHAGVIEQLEDGERVIPSIASAISMHGVLAAAVAGVIIAGIVAATMSTADSQLLVAASGFTENFVQQFLGKKLDEKQSLRLARITILVASVIAMFLAKNPESSVFRIVSFAWAGFGGAFSAVMILSLFWRRVNRQGAIAGIIAGGATVFIWKFLVRPLGGAWDVYELLPAFIVSIVFVVCVSLATPEPSEEEYAEFDKVSNPDIDI